MSALPPLLRYVLLQLPALAVVAILAALLCRYAGLPLWAGYGSVLAWAVKDAVAYPFVRSAYAGAGADGAARLLGRRGVARQALAPRGYVALGGELWRAEVEPGAAPIAAGSEIRVVAAHRLTLVVARAKD